MPEIHLTNTYIDLQRHIKIHFATTIKTYPKMLPTLKPPKTTATALERSCMGIDLHLKPTG